MTLLISSQAINKYYIQTLCWLLNILKWLSKILFTWILTTRDTKSPAALLRRGFPIYALFTVLWIQWVAKSFFHLLGQKILWPTSKRYIQHLHSPIHHYSLISQISQDFFGPTNQHCEDTYKQRQSSLLTLCVVSFT